MDNLKIIKLSDDDWKDYKVLRLQALKIDPEAFGETYEKVMLRTDDEWKMLFEKSVDGHKRWMFFAERNRELVGMVSGTAMSSVKGGVKVREMFVSPEIREKGIATKLMQALIEDLLKNSDKRILRLGVFKTRVEAVNLYKSLGFKVIEEKTEHFSGGLSHESLIMEKNLEAF